MADSDRSHLIEEFCKVTGTDPTRARMYLEAAGWNSNLAMGNFFEDSEDDSEPPVNTLSPPRPTSPKPKVPSSSASSKIHTFASLMNEQPDDEEEEGQAFYAGGSDRSGQQILGPGKRKVANEIVQEMFKAVRSFGAEAVDSSESGHSTAKLKAFRGAGNVLGSTMDTSEAVENPADDDGPSESPDVCLRLWRTGFTVNDGELRDYLDPQNREFLNSIRKGEIPMELRRRTRSEEVPLKIEDHSHEDYIPKKPTVHAFAGTGFRLGSATPPVAAPKPSGSTEENVAEAQKSLNVDDSKPVANVQIRLADGSRLTMQANPAHTIGDVRRFLVQARPEYSASVFSLMTAFPPKELSDDGATLEEENLLNAVIVQKLK
ncbi:NSFL1 cofactor p47-like [Uloborus diversus]|uniref:NSFL1 cofactor p47-like n=1 Tax=Uloborus diversus TaxID=327109 RepID=UPI002409E57A|nr:NSFL1 cofactor p47-like [Uloborus diversus]